MESASGADTAAQAAAERDTLLELLAVFTHDLSNPLQSITVLCELGMDGVGGDDSPAQCLQAAERMRTLIHGLSGFTRGLGRESDIGRVGERLRALLSRRFERHRLHTTYAVDGVASASTPAPLEFALLAVSLGIISSASEVNSRGRFTLEGRADGAETLLIARCQTDDGQPLAPTDLHLARARAIGGSEIAVAVDGPETTLRFGIAP